MSSLERKLKRNQDKETKKLEKKLEKKLNMFSNLPESCLVCDADYDKKNKEQAMSWSIVVKKEIINLYCPECWNKALGVIKDYMEEKNEKLNIKTI